FEPQNFRYARLVDKYSKYIDSPVLKLKFLNSALRLDAPRNAWKRVPLVGSIPERALIVMELAKVLPVDRPVPMGIRLVSLSYRIRYALYALSVVVALLSGVSLVYAVTKIVSSLSVPTEAKDIGTDDKSGPAANPTNAVAALPSGAGLPLDKVWLAEQGEGYEFYSN